MKIRDIRAVGEDHYQVTFDDETQIICRVFNKTGIWAMSAEPDIFMTSQPPRIDSREVAKAVIAFHKSRMQADQ